MKTIKVSVPDLDGLVEALDEHSCYPPLGRAERALADQEAKAQRDHEALTAAEKTVAELPTRIEAGRATSDDLRKALLEREVIALQRPALDATTVTLRARVEAEKVLARKALEAEVAKRREVLVRAAAAITPTLETLRDLDFALGKKLDRQNFGTGVEWPMSWSDELAQANWRQAAMNNPPATPSATSSAIESQTRLPPNVSGYETRPRW